MKKIFFLFFTVAGLTGLTAAQNSDDYKKAEFFVGYSNGQIEQSDKSRNGVNVSGVYNFTRYLGVKGDFSATYATERFTLPGFAVSSSPPFTATFRTDRNDRALYNVLGGIQIKDNAGSGRFKPFAHALFGVGINRSKNRDFQCTPTVNCPSFFAVGSATSKGFAAALGGGLDIRITKKIQFRVIQVDYNPVRTFSQINNNVRIGAGIVF